MSVLIQSWRGQASLVECLVSTGSELIQSWQIAHQRDKVLRNLNDLVQEILGLVARVEISWKSSYRLLFDERLTPDLEVELNAAAAEFKMITNRLVKSLNELSSLVVEMQNLLEVDIGELDNINRAIKTLNKATSNWPKLDIDTANKVLAEHNREERSLTPEEMLREFDSKGVSVR